MYDLWFIEINLVIHHGIPYWWYTVFCGYNTIYYNKSQKKEQGQPKTMLCVWPELEMKRNLSNEDADNNKNLKGDFNP